jgi:hypothetical protein
MTGGQLANGIGSAVAALSSGGFILTYGVLARWYRTVTGRFLMVLAVSTLATCFITLNITAKGFTSQADWLRYLQAVVWISIGATYIYQSWLVWKEQRK